MPTPRHYNRRPPATREAEYKFIVGVINEVCIEIRKFAKKYLSQKNVDYETCFKCLQEVLRSWEMEVSQFATSKEFWDKHKLKTISEEMKEKDGYKTLIFVCERARNFEHMIPSVRESLVDCVRDHLYKYCRSFVEEMGDMEIRPIMEYEENIKANRKEIDSKIDKLNNSILKYGEMKSPFEVFVSDGGSHGALMEEICVLIVEISHAVKKWVADDSSYPERLLQEIFFTNSYKEKLIEDIEKLHEDRTSALKTLDKKHKLNFQTMRNHSYHKADKHKLKQSLETVTLKIERLERQVEEKNEEIDRLKEAIADKTPISPRDRQELRRHLEKAEGELDRLEERKDVMERQKVRLERDLKRVSDRTYELKVEVVTSRHDQEEIKQNVTGIEIEIKSIVERLTSIELKQDVLKRVRKMKVSSDTLRRLHKKKIETRSERHQLEDACKYVAFHIGRDWKRLYDRLPFMPPRDPDRRQKDVEVIDNIAARQDKTPEESALRCLEKWRVFNRQGDIPQLIKSLRQLNKIDLAHKLESRYAVQDVY
ncbi:hypothetical protein FSP39_003279 [Pinctada imbricata]|uniref:Death domain-containing protein n=1 Tax=Pinctada imbricata TaxID=66713 RepID=A0AA89BQ89_PINIB|nr:hypothetical protein FSP39_003279 [Pinctada imbricata]